MPSSIHPSPSEIAAICFGNGIGVRNRFPWGTSSRQAPASPRYRVQVRHDAVARCALIHARCLSTPWRRRTSMYLRIDAWSSRYSLGPRADPCATFRRRAPFDKLERQLGCRLGAALEHQRRRVRGGRARRRMPVRRHPFRRAPVDCDTPSGAWTPGEIAVRATGTTSPASVIMALSSTAAAYSDSAAAQPCFSMSHLPASDFSDFAPSHFAPQMPEHVGAPSLSVCNLSLSATTRWSRVRTTDWQLGALLLPDFSSIRRVSAVTLSAVSETNSTLS